MQTLSRLDAQRPCKEHSSPFAQVPQAAVLATLQLSRAVTLPQFFPNLEQKVASTSDVQVVPQRLAEVAPQVWPAGQVPQATVLDMLQLSMAATLPQFLPNLEQKVLSDSGVQAVPQTLVAVAPHVCPAGQVPQVAVLAMLQLSTAVALPQFLPNLEQKVLSDSGMQAVPQMLAVLAPHVWPAGQVPQVVVLAMLQLSTAVTLPQFLPNFEQKVASSSGVQAVPQTLVAVAPHVWPAGQVPQVAVLAMLQLSTAVKLPQFLPNLKQKVASTSDVHVEVEALHVLSGLQQIAARSA